MANITNTNELLNRITTLTTPLSLPANTFNTKMNANEINTLFESVETCLDNLYVKLRMLEDLHDFTEEYIQNEFNKNKAAMDDAIVKLDQASEDYKNTQNKAMALSFRGGDVIEDRDGRAIKGADVIDGNIIIAGSVNISEATPSKAVVNSTDMVYRRSELPANNYKAFYALEQMPTKNIVESIDFFFSRPSVVNFIKLSAFNSGIKNITIYKQNNETEEVDPNSMIFPECTATGLHLELTSGRIEPLNVQVTGEKDKFTDLENVYTEDVLGTVLDRHIKSNGGK